MALVPTVEETAVPGRRQTERDQLRLSAFGLEVEADFALPGAGPALDAPASERRLAVQLVPQGELWPMIAEPRIPRWLHLFDGRPYAMLEGAEGDVLILYGYEALFHLSADREVLRCGPAAPDDPHWQRLLLDTVLWTASLLRGFELLHASAVESAGGVVAFVAISGGGKTSLAAEHLRRGAALFCDDVVALADSGGDVIAFPGPPLMNLPLRLAPDEIGGAAVADFDGERWVLACKPRPAAQPLAAIVLVERIAGHETRCSETDATSLTLLPHSFGFPHLVERVQRRFDLFGQLAATTPVLRLTADPSVPTTVLADLVETEVGT